MDCERISAMLPELLGSKLDRTNEMETLSHLAHCAQCRKELAFWARLSDTVKADAADMPPKLFDEVSGRLAINQKRTLRECMEITRSTLGITATVLRMVLSCSATRKEEKS